MQKVLLTGAAGRIGSAFRAYEGQRYELLLADRNIDGIGDPGDHEVMQLDVADLDACHIACRGNDTVVHLAADANAGADFYESLLDNNIKGAYNMFRAAKDQGCRRLIFASSIQAVAGYPLDVQPRSYDSPRPLNMYGAAKAFGEAMAHCFAYGEGLSSIAIRIGAYGGNRHIENPDARTLSAFVSQRDMSHLIACCIDVPDVQYAIVQAVSDNRFKRMDLSDTRATVGYAPQDDAFQLFETGIPYRERWHREAETRK